MSASRLRLLHAIHDFLPRHRAGSEIYADALARAQSDRHDVFVLAAEYDPATAHGTIRWRAHDGLPVIELVNNWEFDAFDETYSSPRLNAQLRHVIDAVRPDVLHVHNLLNLSFDLPRLARRAGARSVATLHDYTLVCASGGQRVHAQESHVCEVIDPERCRRCFAASPFQSQRAAGRLTRHPGGRVASRVASWIRGRAPQLAARMHRLPGPAVEAGDMIRREAYARAVFDTIDLFVAPSPFLAREFVRLGLPPDRLRVSDYGFERFPHDRCDSCPALRIGFVGTLVWHKGAHVLLEAARGLIGPHEIHVWGDTSVFPDYTARLRRQADGLPVRFRGGFERSDVARVYGGLDVLVVPSIWPENSPLVVHEAFIYNVAVVGALTGGIPDLISHDVNGLLFDPFDPAALRAALQSLLDDRGLPARLAAAAPDVKSIEQDALEWEDRYREVLRDAATAAAVHR
ncbi:MAG TPA: glycosyltransferase [Vicinamibacterales bacterium]|nr:glycosyltransferase [Vicinamibacterales bacterium]